MLLSLRTLAYICLSAGLTVPALAAPEPSQVPPPVQSPDSVPTPVPEMPGTPPVPEMPDQPGSPEPPPVSVAPERNQWQYIVIHHSASPSGNAASFDRMHRAKGWDGVAYHFVITNGKGGPDGGLEVSPRWWAQKHGAHAGGLAPDALPEMRNGFNEFGIGICLVGNFEQRAPSRAQLKTLARLVTKLQGLFAIPAENVMGHRHVKSTACPGSHFPWGTLFAMTGQAHPQHLYRHALVETPERCPWCYRKIEVAREPWRRDEPSALPPPTMLTGSSR